MEAELESMKQSGEMICSDECMRVIKRIFRALRILILENERWKVEQQRHSGKLTGKEAQHQKAKLRKKWL